MSNPRLLDTTRAGLGRLLPSVPAVVVAVPTLTCPGCWPAYAAMLSPVGLASVMSGPYVPHVIVGLLVVATVPFAVRAARGGGVGPLLIALAASALVVAGKLVLAYDPLTYAGAAALMVAPYWQAIIRKVRPGTPAGCGCDAQIRAEPRQVPDPTVVACTLNAASLGERREMLGDVLGRAAERRESDAGYAFRFDVESVPLPELASMIDLERRCCAFFRFVVTVEPGGGPAWLDLSGPPGTKDFLRGLLGLTPAAST